MENAAIWLLYIVCLNSYVRCYDTFHMILNRPSENVASWFLYICAFELLCDVFYYTQYDCEQTIEECNKLIVEYICAVELLRHVFC